MKVGQPSGGWHRSDAMTVQQRGGARAAKGRRTAAKVTASIREACSNRYGGRARKRATAAAPAMTSSGACETHSLQSGERSLAGTEVSVPLDAWQSSCSSAADCANRNAISAKQASQ
jgi:hypothetical protein